MAVWYMAMIAANYLDMEDDSNKVSRVIHEVMKLAVKMKLYNSKEQVGESWWCLSCWNNFGNQIFCVSMATIEGILINLLLF